MERKLKAILLSALLFCVAQASAAIDADSEAFASEAIISLRSGKYDEALKTVNQGLATNPRSIELKEVKGLALLAKKDEGGALAIFETLKAEPGLNAKRVAGYHYQSAIIQLSKKNYPAARKGFNHALNNKFKEVGAQYYLGLVDLEEKKFDSAREHLLEVISEDPTEFHAPARLYLAQLSNQLNDSASALRFYGRARDDSRTATKDISLAESTRAMARQVLLSTERDLRAYEESLFFAQVGLFAGYDTNILLLPAGALSGAGGTGSPSTVGTLRYGIGYATNPLGDYQIVASYFGNANLNSSAVTQTAQYYTHELSLYVTKDPLSVTNYGMKLQGLGTLQYQKDPTTSNTTFALYALQAAVGPYYRTSLTNRWSIGAEVLFQPQKYYLDQYQPSSNKRSGSDYLARVFVVRESVGGYWNPSASASIDFNNTSGEEFRSKRLNLDFSNSMYVSNDILSSIGLNIALWQFSDRPAGTRNDQFLALSWNTGYRFSSELTGLLQIQAQSNFTNTASYRYTRIVGNVGASYAF